VLPAFVVSGRLDVVEVIGAIVEEVVEGCGGVRPAAARVGVPYTTARGWLRRFIGRAGVLWVVFAALAVELGAEVFTPVADVGGYALAAIGAAFDAACSLPGWTAVGRWRFASAVSGGTLITTNMNTPYLIVGRRRFMPPVP
jgi:hypothetical protein